MGVSEPSLGAPCGAPFVHTYDVQGASDTSPLVGELVEVEAVVTADGRGGPGAAANVDGVFIQDRHGDGDSATSDGLFVYMAGLANAAEPFSSAEPGTVTAVRAGDGGLEGVAGVSNRFDAALERDFGFDPSAPLDVGTRVRISGVAEEYAGETQLRADSVTVCTSEPPLEPLTLELPTADVTATSLGWVGNLEAAEGMFVEVPPGFVVTDLGAFSRYGLLTAVYGELPWVFTQRNLPDSAAFSSFEQALARRTLVLDDGGSRAATLAAAAALGFGATPRGDSPSPLGLVRAPRSGMAGSRGAYRLLVVNGLTWRASEAAGPVAAPEPAVVRIATANLHNLFKDGGDSAACYPSFNSDACRGAASAAERAAQLTRSAEALAALEPDVIAASEVQNDFGGAETTTWQLWVDQLNLAARTRGSGCHTYVPVLPEDYHGGDAIAVALAYCSQRLTLDDWFAPSQALVQGLGPGVFAGPNSSRLPIAARFLRHSDGRALCVAVSHFKSRLPGDLEQRCPNPSLPDCDAGDGQGYFNHARQQAAAALGQWLSGETHDSVEPVLVVGDLNSYAKESPIEALGQLGYRLLTESGLVAEPSYVFDGRLGTIDHALASPQTLPLVTRVGVAMVNVGPGASSAAYSDHNPVFVDLDFDVESSCDCSEPAAVLGSAGDDVLWGSAGDDVICGFGGNDLVFGLGGNDCVSGGLGDDWVIEGGNPQRGDRRRLEGEHLIAADSDANSCKL